MSVLSPYKSLLEVATEGWTDGNGVSILEHVLSSDCHTIISAAEWSMYSVSSCAFKAHHPQISPNFPASCCPSLLGLWIILFFTLGYPCKPILHTVGSLAARTSPVLHDTRPSL
jgi:hypothetical protein